MDGRGKDNVARPVIEDEVGLRPLNTFMGNLPLRSVYMVPSLQSTNARHTKR